jgi:adenosylcobinamide kinase/adenosylcobinamide-phosphate guanylyltransferase
MSRQLPLSLSTPALDRQFVLVTGAARSGKSEWAEHLASQSAKQITYVATAQIDLGDLEWQARIARHQARRPQQWQVAIAPTTLAKTLVEGSSQDCFLIDSLGTWLANYLEQSAEAWYSTQQELVMAMQQSMSDLIVVAEEVGWGVVPAYPLGRLFRDRLGELVRCLAAIAHPVYLVAGGHVLNLSQLGAPLNRLLDGKHD